MKKNGGLEAIGNINNQKAELIYNTLDSGDFYNGTARKDSRSIMNITFRLPSEELEKKFVADALENEMIGLKGHRSVGGVRASIYNAVSLQSVQALVSFMKDFEKTNGSEK
jgi:phosphoserine aminotransferase